MAIAPTIKYFGRFPTSIVLQSTSSFDGTTPQSNLPVITPGLYQKRRKAPGLSHGDISRLSRNETGLLDCLY